MASSLRLILFSVTLLLPIYFSSAQRSFHPRALVLPITKDAATLQYLTVINQRTPLLTISVVLDLGGQALWFDCNQFYESSSYIPARCGSAQCSLAAASHYCLICTFGLPRPGCNNNTCGLIFSNTVTGNGQVGDVSQDVFAIQSTDGKNPGPNVSVRRFLFTCGDTLRLEGLASGTRGMAGLGRERIGLPSQLASAFSFDRKFALCLPSGSSANGVVFFGNGPLTMPLVKDILSSLTLTYTPLLVNPVSTAPAYVQGDRSTEYFIGVKAIKVNEKPIKLNTTLLSIQNNGYGGTKVSTVNPYTVLETSIYNALTSTFVKESKLTRVAYVAPFEFCFDSTNVASTRAGPAVPTIDLVMQSGSAYWRLFGANSMVQLRDNVLCLGFVDGGVNPRTSIIIGGHQLEDNLLQFDLADSRVGFSSSLLLSQTTCSNFNFTSIA